MKVEEVGVDDLHFQAAVLHLETSQVTIWPFLISPASAKDRPQAA